MEFRDWHDGDDLRLLELFSDPFNAQHHHDRAMLGSSTQEPFGVGMVAVDDDIPVAAGALRAQSIHPQRMWCYIETAPLQRQRGIATALLKQLLSRAPENTELKTRSAATDTATATWLTNQGFAPIQHTQRVLVALKSFEPADIEVQPIATGSVELSKVVAEYYNATHGWDPSDITLTQAQQLLLAPQTGAQQALITRTGNGITAFAIAYPGPVPNVVDVFIGHDPNHSDPTEHIRALLATASAERSLAIELDNSTTILNPLIESAVESDTAIIEHESTIWATDVPPHA